MHIIDLLYNKYYPLTVINKKRSMKKNKNKDFTLLTSNCIGGYIYHQLGIPFQSPTINLMMLQPDFYKFIFNLEHYLSLSFEDAGIQLGVPSGTLGDITVYFTHYNSFESGVSSWEKRKKRINMDNLYIIATESDGVTCDDIAKLGTIKCKKLICFTVNKYDYPYCFQVEEFKGRKELGNILGKTLSGKWRFEKFFDYVSWLNSDCNIAEQYKII